MSIFHFNVRRGAVVYADTQGIEFVGLNEAADHARRDALEIMRGEPELAAGGQSIEIEDSVGNVLMTIPFETVRPSA